MSDPEKGIQLGLDSLVDGGKSASPGRVSLPTGSKLSEKKYSLEELEEMWEKGDNTGYSSLSQPEILRRMAEIRKDQGGDSDEDRRRRYQEHASAVDSLGRPRRIFKGRKGR